MRPTPAAAALAATLAAALAAAAGCVGEIEMPSGPTPDDPGPTSTARTVYERDVHPVMTAKCSGGACHTQPGATGMYGFAAADAGGSYAQVVGTPLLVGAYTPSSAGLLTKVAAGHKGVTYTAADTAAITGWLAQEIADREEAGTPPPIDPEAVLRTWSGCLSLENFTAANMTLAWSTLGTATNQACINCHVGGLATFLITDDDATFFQGLTTQRDFLVKYFTVDGAGSVIINTAAMESAGRTLAGHPRFDPTTNAGMTALQELHDLTLARQAANTCDPPRLP